MKRLLLRFDDLHPYMNPDLLEEIKIICKKYNNSVLLCVIPFCEDEKLIDNNKNLSNKFWQIMRYCQKEKAAIGLHGYKHKLFEIKNKQILPISNKTEFCGVNIHKQREMIRKGKNYLENNGLKIDFFAAPAHSFDNNTIKILKEFKIDVISDGFFSSCTSWKGIKWLPLKIWRENSIFIGSFSTVCKHPKEIHGKYDCDINLKNERQLTSFKEEVLNTKNLTLFERIIHIVYSLIFLIYRLKKFFIHKNIRKRIIIN